MGKFNLNFSLFSSHIFLFSLFIFCNLITATSTDQLIPNPIQGIGCSLINCGQGTCVNDTSLLGFDCVCNPGWKKLQIGSFLFPSCILPNCTINLSCSNVSSPPPPPPPASSGLPQINISDPCALVWCGDGTCAATGTGHTCQCFPGSENLFDNSALACFKQCSIGADCRGLGLGIPIPSPPTSSSGSPGNGNYSASPGNGSIQASNNSSKLGTLTIILLIAATIHTWF